MLERHVAGGGGNKIKPRRGCARSERRHNVIIPSRNKAARLKIRTSWPRQSITENLKFIEKPSNYFCSDRTLIHSTGLFLPQFPQRGSWELGAEEGRSERMKKMGWHIPDKLSGGSDPERGN